MFALGPDRVAVPPARLLDVVEVAFAGFRRRQRERRTDASCSCNACRSVGNLDLKADVILAHRLLKNNWARGSAYLYDHLGDVRCCVRDLAPSLQPAAAGS